MTPNPRDERMSEIGNRLTVKAPDAVGCKARVELDGVPLWCRSLTLRLTADDFTIATMEVEVIPDVDVGACVHFETDRASEYADANMRAIYAEQRKGEQAVLDFIDYGRRPWWRRWLRRS